jgi:integrase/recombinase XerD
MIRWRKIMLEELQRRNFAKTTVQYYLQAVEDFAACFGKSPGLSP